MPKAARKTVPKPTIRYEFDFHPDIGQSMEVLPGIRWLRMPLPFMLGHINLWMLQDGERWTLVDTGLHTETTRDLWEIVLTKQLKSAGISRVLVTHLHPDHVGCAGWLTRRCEAPLWMSREEYLQCRVLVEDKGQTRPTHGIDFYTAAGFPEDAMESYEKSYGMFGSVVSVLPPSYRRLTDGMRFRIGEHEWRIVVGRGHSVEHACMFCEELNVIISGDQILPTISSNVSVYPSEPLANPLADWFDSLRMLKRFLPEDVLVLPAHGKPFRGAHVRLDQLITEHEVGLEKLFDICRQSARAIDTFDALFKSKINDGNLVMATGEAVAHLNYLQEKDLVYSWVDEDQVRWYQSSS